jgi:hypothetical protein
VRPSVEKPFTKGGGLAQGDGPEFKLQYDKKEKVSSEK